MASLHDADADPSKIAMHHVSFVTNRLNLNPTQIICNYPVKPQSIILKKNLKLFVFSW